MIRSFLTILLGLAVLSAILYAVHYALMSPYRIDATEAKRRLAAGTIDVVLDVRTAAERRTIGAYPGALAIPSADLTSAVQQAIPNKGARVLVYCNTGQRARAATELLRSMGYTDVVYIATPHTTLM